MFLAHSSRAQPSIINFSSQEIMDLASNPHLIRILGTIFAGLLGLAFGSFLNVCLSRWPAGESIVKPGSHCRNCDHTLAWWENIPLLSWLVLRGRCSNCQTPISWRYPLVELAVGALWAYSAWSTLGEPPPWLNHPLHYPEGPFIELGQVFLLWLLVALAALDAEQLWLPNKLTIPGILLGIIQTMLVNRLFHRMFYDFGSPTPPFAPGLLRRLAETVAAAALILLIRWLYKLIRHREGIGLGDAKLMALLAAWLGLPGALLSFFLGAILGSLAALTLLAIPIARRDSDSWANSKLPLGTFLCIGGIVSSLWGQQILAAYFRWAGF
jgi:leader peptidase (prepilin peptidase)/N-methyltransferase